jgi:hypothetical protein
MSVFKEARMSIHNRIHFEQSKLTPNPNAPRKSKMKQEEIGKFTTFDEAEALINKKIKHEQKFFEDNELEFHSILNQDAVAKKVATNNWSGMELIPSIFESSPEHEREIVKELNNIDAEIWMKGMKGWVFAIYIWRCLIF